MLLHDPAAWLATCTLGPPSPPELCRLHTRPTHVWPVAARASAVSSSEEKGPALRHVGLGKWAVCPHFPNRARSARGPAPAATAVSRRSGARGEAERERPGRRCRPGCWASPSARYGSASSPPACLAAPSPRPGLVLMRTRVRNGDCPRSTHASGAGRRSGTPRSASARCDHAGTAWDRGCLDVSSWGCCAEPAPGSVHRPAAPRRLGPGSTLTKVRAQVHWSQTADPPAQHSEERLVG